MIKQVYKYSLDVVDNQFLDLPQGAEMLCVEQIGDPLHIQAWALVNPAAPLEPRRFRVAGTGHAIDEDDLVYVGTAFDNLNGLVWHVFVEPELPDPVIV